MTPPQDQSPPQNEQTKDRPRVVIIGAGIAGLVLALALKKHCGVVCDVYEQAPAFADNVGGAIGMYANGLRVIRDIAPELLERLREQGYPYLQRRWMRHDGTEVACGDEAVLARDEPLLQSIGIRRWRLQNALTEAAVEHGILIQFGKRLRSAVEVAGTGESAGTSTTLLTFEDGTTTTADVVFGADGIKSRLREAIFGATDVGYTGVTCLMGAAPIARPMRGICFPSSSTSKCHACYYPTGMLMRRGARSAWRVASTVCPCLRPLTRLISIDIPALHSMPCMMP